MEWRVLTGFQRWGVGKGCWGKKAGLLAPPKCDGIPSPAGGNTGLRAEAHGLTLAGRREVASPLEQGPTPNAEGRHGTEAHSSPLPISHLYTHRDTHTLPVTPAQSSSDCLLWMCKRDLLVTLAIPGSPHRDTRADTAATMRRRASPSNDPSIRAAEPRVSGQADSVGYGGGRRGPGAHSHVEDVALVAEIALGQRGELLDEGARQHRGRQSPGQVSPHCRSHQRSPEDPRAALQMLHDRPRRPPSASTHRLGHRLALHPGRHRRLPLGACAPLAGPAPEGLRAWSPRAPPPGRLQPLQRACLRLLIPLFCGSIAQSDRMGCGKPGFPGFTLSYY